MIDISLLRSDRERYGKKLLKKEPSFDIDNLLLLDGVVRALRISVEELRKNKNELAMAGSKGFTEELRKESIALGINLKKEEVQLKEQERQYEQMILSVPNLVQDIVPEGNKEANQEVRSYGEIRNFSFDIKNHMQLNDKHNWFDMEAATAMSGAQFALYHEMGAKVLYALTHLMIKNNVRYGFKPVIPPALVQDHALVNSGNLPKFKGDFYSIPEDGLNLIPTAEVSLTNLYAKKILTKEQLPIRHVAWSSCFRREAGGYGSQERGLIRIHQFEKVELYSIAEPEQSDIELEQMIAAAENMLQQLGLHYRVMLLAGQDCSFPSARTYDIEVWLPGQNRYYEVASCSNCTDFQSRRAGIRYRSSAGAKTQLVHTLNASSLALPRLMVALMEQGQQEDGSIVLPDLLQQTMDILW